MKKQKGFTLIEVMIVVVIVAILAAVAIPSYQDSVRKTRRADAKEALTRLAALQERYFFTKNNYGSLNDIGMADSSQDGHYTLTVSLSPACGAQPCFTASASAKLTGTQAGDTRCRIFSLNHIGQKTAKASDNTTTTTDECW